MSLRKLPEAMAFQRPQGLSWETPAAALEHWRPAAATATDPSTIQIFDVIGEDPWSGGGFTAKRMAAALRSIGEQPVTVQINSPGGYVDEGLTIYNLLRRHNAKVTVEVLGMAASAASIIAMAGDEIVMGLGTFMLVHNAWALVIGNQHDLRDAADQLGALDGGLVDIYEARTGRARAEIEAMMARETLMPAGAAVAEKFADRTDAEMTAPADDPKNAADRALLARRRIEANLAKGGMPRHVRAELLAEISAAPRDASRNPAARDAGDLNGLAESLRRLKATITS